MNNNKELYRAREGRWLAGVCAGLAKYMNLTPTVVRCILIAMALFFGGGILVYIASIFLIPLEPPMGPEQTNFQEE